MENVWEAAKKIRKALAVALAGGVVVLLGRAGVVADIDTVETLVTFGITALMTYVIPNAKDGLDG